MEPLADERVPVAEPALGGPPRAGEAADAVADAADNALQQCGVTRHISRLGATSNGALGASPQR